MAHHAQTIDRLTAHFCDDPNFPSLIVGGSIAKGWAKPDSDVDITLVATGDEYARRVADHALHYFTLDFCDYPGGYVDGKIVDLRFLREVADHGSEPARAAFVGAFAAYSRFPDLDDLLRRITAYPEDGLRHRLESFVAQVYALQWYVGEAEKRADRYLMTQMVGDLVLFGGRLILAYNRILYPYHKWFLTALRDAPEQPAALMGLIDDLLAQPSKARADTFCEAILGFADWPRPTEGWPARFMQDREWNWRDGHAPIADW
jgi:hypothetical protein